MKAWGPFAEDKRTSNELRERLNLAAINHKIRLLDMYKALIRKKDFKSHYVDLRLKKRHETQ
ncbi:hypothetical protein AZI86_07775 [Bdellovibrio bacteriovorus]|uniref:Uncharacterized protein n=1 Tax=Bdellovibrio bacteriovorus TaxID=959 RepID=A0A150WRB8_BDEBC|nr:hypothetical protein AZI86_07775 [Bdellovibrio bacteriovorus]